MSEIVAASRWCRVPKPPAKECGLGRGSIYKLAKQHRKLLRKFGSATLLDRQLLAEIVAELPEANIGDLKETAA
jgi:hypothetical protein